MTSSWTTGRIDGLVPAAELGAHRHLVVSERLRARRRELGLTQKEVVARLRGMGVFTTNKALSALEHGAGQDVAKLPELACALECTLTWLVGLTDSCGRWQPDGDQWPDRSREQPGQRQPPHPPPTPPTPPDRQPNRQPDGQPRRAAPWILGPVTPE